MELWDGFFDPSTTVPTHRIPRSSLFRFWEVECVESALHQGGSRGWVRSLGSFGGWAGGLVGNFSKRNRGGNGNYTKARFWMMSLWFLVSSEWRMLSWRWDPQSCSNKKLATGMYILMISNCQMMCKSNMLCKPKRATGLWYECCIFLVISMQGEQPSSWPMEYRKCLGMVSHQGFWDSHLRSQRHGCGEMIFQFSNGVSC